MTPKQLSFDLPAQVSLGPDDYFVSGANAHAYAMATLPDGWAEGKLVVVGPKGSGKSHLARVFQHVTGAAILSAADLADMDDLPDTAIVVEDMETLPRTAEEDMFHLHNHLRARRKPLLMTAQSAPARWDIALPDLASRMQASPAVDIGNPDDRLLSAVLMKLFADRQLFPKPNVIAYLLKNMERSYTSAADVVALLDKEALAKGSKVTVGLARAILDISGEHDA